MIKVLIVDDDFMVARIHSGFVAQMPGFEVSGVARTGAQALIEARRILPDLVLLDIHLPDISGLDLLGQLRSAVPDLDVLVISAARESETVRRALRGGIVHYLMKPFTQEDLHQRLEHYRRTYRSLESVDTADQSDVDAVFGLAGTEKPLPKGCGPETMERVQVALRSAGGDLSAFEVGQMLGLSRVSARRYLEYLNDIGRARVELRYGSGRPERRYSWRGLGPGPA
ncbi:response regulator [Paeniglutamicibacter antarcticus]|uniref:Transcriptional regulatory protein n=1 Tax=Paeniglutamicibacter antarcticus TaxID=494023 RepID=A0ABP9TKA1_9MICC